MAISRGVSIPNIYTKILTDNRAKQEMSWEMILTLTYKLETLSWSDAELSLFMPIYTTFLDSQYVLHETSNTPKTLPLRPLLDTYLQLVEQSPEVSIPINLILDLVKRPLYYTSSIDTTAFLFVILRKIANRISTVSYSEESLRNHKDDLLIEIYHDFHAALPIAEKVLFEPILDQVAIKERHRT